MPSLKEAQVPPRNLKDMVNLSSAATTPQQGRTPPPPDMAERTGLNQLSIGPTPSMLTTAYDNIRQWIRPGTPQFRTAPLPPKTNQQVGAFIQSTIVQNAAPSAPPAAPGLIFRGNWQSFVTYKVNDVVQFNISTYLALNTSTNAEPDNNPTNWVLFSKNLNFRGQWTAGQSFIQSAYNIGVVTVGVPRSVTFLSDNTAGNAVVVYVITQNGIPGNITVSDSQNNTYARIASYADSSWPPGTPSYRTTMFSASNIKAGANTVTFMCDQSSIQSSLIVAEYSENPLVAPVIKSSATQDGTSGTTASVTLTTLSPGDIVALFFWQRGMSTIVPPAGFTLRANSYAIFEGVFLTDKVIPVPGTNIYTVSNTDTSAGQGEILWGLVISGNPVQYEPFDVVEYLGSTYVCISTTTTTPTDTTHWYQLSQGSGGINNLIASYTAVSGDYGKLLTNTSSSNYTLTLPPTPPLAVTQGSAWWIALQNSGTGTITINPNGRTLDGGLSNLVLNQNQGVYVFTDGTNYFTERGYGTVTNLTMPSIFTVGAIGGTGILPITLANESANTVWAGPTSGPSATPTFRTLGSADVPLAAATIFNRKVISATSYTTVSSDIGTALDVQTSAATAITLTTIPYATPVFVQAIGASSGGSTSATLVKAYVSNNAAGNLLTCAVRNYNAGGAVVYTITDSAGNTWVKAPAGFLSHGTGNVDLWYVANCLGGPNTVTLTGPSTDFPRFVIAEHSGLLTAAALDTQASAQSSVNSTTPNSGNITTTQTVKLLVGFCENETLDLLTNTPSAGWTARASTDGNIFYCDQIVSTAGTYSFSSTLSSSVAWGAYIAAFKAPLSATPFSGFIQNNGTAIVTISPASGLINGAASIGLFPGQGCTIATDGVNFTAVTWDPAVVAKVDLTAQGAAIAATTLYAVPTGKKGMYRVSWSAKVTQAATTSSTLGGAGGFQVTYTDADDSVVVTPLAQPNAAATGNTTGTQLSDVVVVNAAASSNIQYRIDYTSVGATPMQYNLHIKLEYLG